MEEVYFNGASVMTDMSVKWSDVAKNKHALSF